MTFNGSAWNKWDLHVHTIYTHMNSHYSCGMKEIATKVKEEDIKVVGVTNYFLVLEEEVEELKAELDEDVKIIPNFEFRINEKNKDGDFINIHVMFNPTTTTISKIHETLARVPLSNISASNKYCNLSCIQELGCASITVSLNDLLTQLKKDFTELNDFVVVGVNKGYGGSCPGGKPRDIELAIKIDKESHLYFSSKKEDRDFFLNKEAGRDAHDLLPKPLIIASDAHKIGDIGSQYSWVKAETTFEGFKQLVHEPEGRISLIENKPTKPLRTIDSIQLSFSNDTNIIHVEDKRTANNESKFCLGITRKITFSPFFTCIIGGRGSGKSTILNLIAEKAIGATDFFKSNFLRENDTDIDPKGFIEIDGTEDIEFISQNQVEKFANNEELTEAIYDRLRSLYYQDFVDLEEKNKVHIKAIDNQIQNINDKHDLVLRIAELQHDLAENRKIVNHYNSDEYKALKKAISDATNSKNEIERSKEKYELLVDRLKDVVSEFAPEADRDNGYENEIKRIIKVLTELTPDISFEEDENKVLAYQKIITDKSQELEMYMRSQGVSEEDSNEYERSIQNIPVIELEIKEKEKALKDVAKKIEKFEADEANIETTKTSYEKKIESSLAPMNSQLVNIDKNVADIRFEYRYDEQLAKNNLLDEFEMHFKEFKPSEHSTRSDAVGEYLFCVEPWDVDDYDTYMSELERFRGQTNAKELVKSVFNKRVNFDSYKLLIKKVKNDVITHKKIVGYYDSKEFRKCSFGQKCTAVIVALLMFGNKPIIIDEPEAHLDSKLIAEYLIKLIKERKRNRQIIFATHNANFVVNGDAELIHCLEIDEATNFTKIISTTIENLKNRERLLALEGGKEAFELRDRKLLR